MSENAIKNPSNIALSNSFVIREIEIEGFKSFATKVKIPFSRGINCITGTGGSGKSNLLLALQWVLGKELQNVIFAGAVFRPPAEFAKVTATFDNRSRRLNVDCDNVTIRRSINRQGDSYFLLNDERLTAREVEDLYEKNGHGIPSYAFFDEYQMHRLLGDARERRIFIEEATGLSSLRTQLLRSETQRRILLRNLRRVRDIQREICRGIGARVLQAKPEEAADRSYPLTSDELSHLKEMYDHQQRQITEMALAATNATNIHAEKQSHVYRLYNDMIEKTNDRMTEILNRIWHGCSAKIILLNESQPLLSDMEIDIALPNQPVRSIRLVTSGQKVMLAIIIMFAAYEIHPHHFCVLDNTDAALDDKNIESFILLLKEFAASTQIILATNRNTIAEHAQTKYHIAADTPA